MTNATSKTRAFFDDDTEWKTAHATFGAYGWWRRTDSDTWQPSVYSLSRGIYKDPLHRNLYGVHGHVPEEFLDFGDVKAGQGVVFRTRLHSPETRNVHLALGAPAAKQARLNDHDLGADRQGYLWLVPALLRAGNNHLEFRLTAEKDVRLRAYYAFVNDRDRFARPEWIVPADTPQRDSSVRLAGEVDVPFLPSRVRLRVAAEAVCRVLLNDEEIGCQHHFENVEGEESIRTYEVTAHLPAGPNEITVTWTEAGRPAPLLVDARFEASDGRFVSLATGPKWRAFRGHREVGVHVRRRQGFERVWWGTRSDPAWLHLWRRPHPLPGSAWLEGDQDDTVLRVQPDAFEVERRAEWFRFAVPPGATAMQLDLAGEAGIFLDEKELTASAGRVELPQPEALRRVCTLRVVPQRGCRGGSVFRQPVSFEVGPGRMNLGDWVAQGLTAYAGGVSYSRTVHLDSWEDGQRAVLDLGRVRGTAEVFVHRRSAGVRVWSPYRFDLTEHLRGGENPIEVQVFGTLAPYLDAISPTPYVFPGQTESGLFGPVRLCVLRGTPSE